MQDEVRTFESDGREFEVYEYRGVEYVLEGNREEGFSVGIDFDENSPEELGWLRANWLVDGVEPEGYGYGMLAPVHAAAQEAIIDTLLAS